MISISFPTNGSWQLGKFVNTEEDVNGYITLKNQGTYIEITNNTGQDLSGKPFFIEFIGSDFDALKWELTPLSVLDFQARKGIYIVLSDGSTIYSESGDFDTLTDVLFVISPLCETGYTMKYSDGTEYVDYAAIPAGIYKYVAINQDGIVGQHIYFTDQFGNILKFWRVAFDYTHKYTAYIVQLSTIDDVPVLFTDGSTIKIYVMTNATTSYAQDLTYPLFMAIHPQIPGYIAGAHPDTETIYFDNLVVTSNYFTGIDLTPREVMKAQYGYVYWNETTPRQVAWGFLSLPNNPYIPGWIIDMQVDDATGWNFLDLQTPIITLGKCESSSATGNELAIWAVYLGLNANNLWFNGLGYDAEDTLHSCDTKFGISLGQRFIGNFTGYTSISSQSPSDGFLKGYIENASNYITSSNYHDLISGSIDNVADIRTFKMCLTSGVKIYRVISIGFIPEILNLFTDGTDPEKMDKIVRFYDIPRNLTTGGAGYWLSPIIDLGMQPPDFSISWVADETYGRIDTDNIDPKEIEWRYSIYPPDGMATGTITDSEGVEHAYWDPETTWDTASEWQKIESSEQLPPYRYAQFRISLLAD